MKELEHATAAIAALLARHDIKDREKVRLVLVTSKEETTWQIEDAIKADLTPQYAIGISHGDGMRINGVEILVRAEKRGVSL